MKRKRLIKILMRDGIPRNEAVVYANACSGTFSHGKMLACVAIFPQMREVVRPMLMKIRQGLSFKVNLEEVND